MKAYLSDLPERPIGKVVTLIPRKIKSNQTTVAKQLSNRRLNININKASDLTLPGNIPAKYLRSYRYLTVSNTHGYMGVKAYLNVEIRGKMHRIYWICRRKRGSLTGRSDFKEVNPKTGRVLATGVFKVRYLLPKN